MMSAVTLGKRKRADQLQDKVNPPKQPNDAAAQLHNILRQNFELRFAPIEPLSPKEAEEPIPDLTNSEGSEESDWAGFSDDNNDANVLVIEHTASISRRAEVPKEELKTFMVLIYSPPNSNFKLNYNPRDYQTTLSFTSFLCKKYQTHPIPRRHYLLC